MAQINAEGFSQMPQMDTDYFVGTLVAELVEDTIRKRKAGFPQMAQINANGFSQMPQMDTDFF
jgi:predicted transcriptional regulator